MTRLRWTVRVRPRHTEWHAAREVLAGHPRPVLDETPHELVLGAAHEAEARQIAIDLQDLDCIASIDCRRLGWFTRWRLRERLLRHERSAEPF